MKNYLRLVSIALCLFMVLALAACGGGSAVNSDNGEKKQVIKLTIGAGHPSTSMPYVRAAEEFFVPEVAKRVEENTDYTIEWTKAYGGSIAKLAEGFWERLKTDSLTWA